MSSLRLAEDIIRLSHEFGGDPEYCRAGGGNSSYKQDGILHIKPSGVPLATLEAQDLVPLNINVLLEALHANSPVGEDPVMVAARRARVDDGVRRPSVEILFHALIDDPLVLHLHPRTANAITCNEAGEKLAHELLGNKVLWVEYADPGVPLARKIAKERSKFVEQYHVSAPPITLLENHGIIVSGAIYSDITKAIKVLTETIRNCIEQAARDTRSHHKGAGSKLFEIDNLRNEVLQILDMPHFAYSSDIELNARTIESNTPVTLGPAIPDQVVYAGSLPLVVNDFSELNEGLKRYRNIHKRDPIVTVIPGQVILAVGKSEPSAQIALETFIDALRVAEVANKIGNYKPLNLAQRSFIEQWEAEAYRRAVAGV